MSARASLARFWRNPVARYGALLLSAAAILIVALAPLASLLVEQWSLQDVKLRSRLVFQSIREQVASDLAATPGVDLTPFFEGLAQDERLLALGFCDQHGRLLYATKQMPKSIDCASVTRAKTDTFSVISYDGRRIFVSVFPMTGGKVAGHLLVLHDLTYVDARARKASFYMVMALMGAVIGLGVLATIVMLTLMRQWTHSMRSVIADIRSGAEPIGPPSAEPPIGREFRTLFNELRVERKFTDGIQVDWSPKTLGQLLVEELPGAEVLVVSNREPYIHNRGEDGEVTLLLPASGLVSALEPIMRTCGGTWIAHGSGSADRETVDARDHIRVPPAAPEYTLRRVWLSDDDVEGYYYGIANEGLWPLCHIAFVRPIFREADWARYVAVNARFAEVVVAEAGREDPIVLVQDYHFALLPRMIRQRLPKATIITFWHIPWPNAETFGICPWREQIIDGLLGSTILGFHTQFHCNNFLEATDRFMESRIDRETASVTVGGHETLIRPYPISIEWPPRVLATQASIEECRAAVRRRYGLADDARLGVGIERFDYTKGILDRIHAVDDLLIRQPEWRGKFVFIQAAAPTRGKLGAYSDLRTEALRLADEVNTRHGGSDYKPLQLVIRHHDQREVYELFRAADVCIVSSLHDGMNLVAKEFVAARDDEHGVLILSSFAGASRELSEALIVNPYDTHGMAGAIGVALGMSEEEQLQRMRLMRDLVRQRNVYRWAAQMLLDAARLRKRERILMANATRR
jgi:trehalose 6-phosphate synthase